MKRLSILIAALALLAGSAHATEFRNRLSLGGGYGVSWPETPSSFRTTYDDAQPLWTGYLGYGLTQDTTLRASYTNMRFDAKHGSARTTLQPILLSLKMNLIHDAIVSPYLLLGAGVSDNKIDDGRGHSTTWTDFAAQGGAGLEFFFGPNFSISAEGRYDYVTPKSGKAITAASALGMLNLYFGKEDRTGTPQAAAAPANTNAAAAPQTTVIVKNDNQDAERAARAAEAAAASAQAAQLAVSSATTVTSSSGAVAEAQAKVQDLQQKIQSKEVPPIMFATGSDQLLPASNTTLDKVAAIAQQYPGLKLTVEGHTDNVGDKQKNQDLSQRRADAVKTYLVAKGVDADRVTAVGYGDSRPLASNDTAAGRDQNRRVEFKFQQ